MYLKQKDVKALNGFICQSIDTSARLLEARKITFGYPKNWQNYWQAEKLRTVPSHPSPTTAVPLTTSVEKTHMAVLAPRKHIPVCSHRPEYSQSKYHCRMASSPDLFSKCSGY